MVCKPINKDENVIYANPASDITGLVIELYDKKINESSGQPAQ